MIRSSLFICCVLLVVGCGSTKKVPKIIAGVHFVESESLGEVLDMAANSDKLVFVDFYTTWCLPCKQMDEDVYPDQDLGDEFNKHFVSYKVDAEKDNGPNLAFLYEVYAYPTLLFMDTKGRVLVRKNGAAYHTEMRRLMAEALALKKPL